MGKEFIDKEFISVIAPVVGRQSDLIQPYILRERSNSNIMTNKDKMWLVEEFKYNIYFNGLELTPDIPISYDCFWDVRKVEWQHDIYATAKEIK